MSYTSEWRLTNILYIVGVLQFLTYRLLVQNYSSIELFTIGVSVRLSDRSITQGRAKKKYSSKIAASGVWNQDLQIFRPMAYQLGEVEAFSFPAWI